MAQIGHKFWRWMGKKMEQRSNNLRKTWNTDRVHSLKDYFHKRLSPFSDQLYEILFEAFLSQTLYLLAIKRLPPVKNDPSWRRFLKTLDFFHPIILFCKPVQLGLYFQGVATFWGVVTFRGSLLSWGSLRGFATFGGSLLLRSRYFHGDCFFRNFTVIRSLPRTMNLLSGIDFVFSFESESRHEVLCKRQVS